LLFYASSTVSFWVSRLVSDARLRVARYATDAAAAAVAEPRGPTHVSGCIAGDLEPVGMIAQVMSAVSRDDDPPRANIEQARIDTSDGCFVLLTPDV
jgi:hypothetical protein